MNNSSEPGPVSAVNAGRIEDVVERPHLVWWVLVLSGMGLLGALVLSDGAFEMFSTKVTTFFSRPLLTVIFVAAVLAHVGEATVAFLAARKAGLKSAGGWTVQTFVLGYPSLSLLLARVRSGA